MPLFSAEGKKARQKPLSVSIRTGKENFKTDDLKHTETCKRRYA